MNWSVICSALLAINWSAVWAAISAFFAGLTAFIALWAMFRWRKQEELKAKLNFKMAIADYAFQLTQMPEKLDHAHIRHAQIDNCAELTRLLSACLNAWVICEGLLDKKENVVAAWDYIFENNKNYFQGALSKSAIGEKCIVILNERFVFSDSWWH